jgi:hypothetical protein
VAQGKHIDGERCATAGRPRAFGDAIAVAPSRRAALIHHWMIPLTRTVGERVRKLYLPLGGPVTFGRGALMSLPTPPNERLSLTEPSGALASCA